MTVYVDDAVHPFGRMLMCHMVSPDVAELHAMADMIGVQRRWFQNPLTMSKVSRPHYDIAKGKRALAVKAGAVEITRYQMVVISNVAMNRLCAERHAQGIGHPTDPLALFRRYDSARLAEMEMWLGDQLGSAAVDESRRLARVEAAATEV